MINNLNMNMMNNNLNMNMMNNFNMNMMNNNLNMNMMNNNLNMNMMNNLNMNIMNNNLNMNMIDNPNMNRIESPNIKNKDNVKYEDVYPYIKENKIRIILTGIKNKNKNKYILIPISLKQNELYYTARKFRDILNYNLYSEIKLYHKNKLLNDDDSSIEFILNEDIIYMESDTNFNSLYYQSILEIYKDSPKINIRFKSNCGFNLARVFPNNISIRQMFNIFFKEMNLDKNKINSLCFLYNGCKINIKDDKILKNMISNNENITTITFFKNCEFEYDIPGKKIEISIENNKGIILDFKVGTLEQISIFRKRLIEKIDELKYKIINNPVLYPGNIEVEEDNEKTFSSIGIRDDCICKVNLSEI